jgi:hypothetical protein
MVGRFVGPKDYTGNEKWTSLRDLLYLKIDILQSVRTKLISRDKMVIQFQFIFCSCILNDFFTAER